MLFCLMASIFLSVSLSALCLPLLSSRLYQEFDPKAGSGCTMTMGQLVRSFLLKLEWYGTLFPRIPVPVQKDIEKRLRDLGLCDDHKRTAKEGWGEAEDYARQSRGDRSVSNHFCNFLVTLNFEEVGYQDAVSLLKSSACVVDTKAFFRSAILSFEQL